MRRLSFVTDTASVTRILQHLGEPTQPPVSPAQGAPKWEESFNQSLAFDPSAAGPALAFEFDQTVVW
jgi:hypothetical protein